ncbi:transporter substrate-binding domain-containing protein [Actinoplanes aureus]|uniref:Transporter substrate-binding domain-containing protein n=1 Tax=Actinoplanes aureus TaxID=2792083 RepID=A0A931CF01_9ACTN|nr:transporter substrate-binding domain-containing protein [Actinoplanes aureus]MBG0568899.1 transporter substrate-binding domain-containing protein [Actinoplanes aureus]
MGDRDTDDDEAAWPAQPAPTEPAGVRGLRWPRQWSGDLGWGLRRRVEPAPVTVEEIASRDIAEQEVLEEVISEIEHRSIVDGEYRFKAWRLAGLGLLIVLTLAVTLGRLLVGGPPSVAELRAQAGVDDWTELAIGVKDDQFGTAYRDPATGVWSGFDIDIAYMIAEDLGFRRDDVRFYGLESEDRARMQATEPGGDKRVPVQLVIASYSITPAREAMAGVTFSQGYLDTEQSVATLTEHAPVSALEDLAGKEVCTLSTATSQSALVNFKAVVVQKNRVRECFELLDAGEVEAVSTDAAILAGYKHRFPDKYAHWDLGLDATERWGVNVGENPALKTLVDLTLYRSYIDPQDGRWEEAWQDNFQVELKENGTTPIAIAEQPRVERPDVRQLPWENLLG